MQSFGGVGSFKLVTRLPARKVMIIVIIFMLTNGEDTESDGDDEMINYSEFQTEVSMHTEY